MKLRKRMTVAVLCTFLLGCNNEYSSGDRVLVSKIAYDTPLAEPRRFDVVVFKFPGGGNQGGGPVEGHTPKNYIKRLLGLPGELLAIFFGRIYRLVPQPGEAPPFDDSGSNPQELYKKEKFLHFNDEPGRSWFADGRDRDSGKERRFEIVRMTPAVKLAERRCVYDNDYQARDLKGKFDRWAPSVGSGWKTDTDKGFASDAKNADRVDWLRYQHLLRPDQGPVVGGNAVKRSLITDTMDYNSFQTEMGDRSPTHVNWVGDLMIECDVDVVEPKGEFWFELSKGIYRFQARWDLSSGQCTLYRLDQEGNVKEFATQATRVKSAGAYQLRFANIDACLTVWVGRDLPFGNGAEYDPPEIRGPADSKLSNEQIAARRGPTENDLEPASIGSKGARVKISHVRVFRATYYTTFDQPDFDDHGGRDADFWANPLRWDPLRKQRFATMFVQPGHYLCLGDNSQASSDSRDWGLVPQRLMLGRALTVYFPLDRLGPIR